MTDDKFAMRCFLGFCCGTCIHSRSSDEPPLMVCLKFNDVVNPLMICSKYENGDGKKMAVMFV
jgi:hypothetical protein